MQTIFLIEIGFCVKDLKIRYYKDIVNRKKIKSIRYAILWRFETYGGIVVRLKAIKYNENSFYYLFFYPLTLAFRLPIF